jgi:glutathione gamma-glutamylcysteinyltransferase
LAKCNGANVALHRSGSFSLEEFRAAVQEVCSSGEEHVVVSYTRKAFSQTGDGHFSPVGGYHADRDLVLILDTVSSKLSILSPVLVVLIRQLTLCDPAQTTSHLITLAAGDVFCWYLCCKGLRGGAVSLLGCSLDVAA